MKATRFLTLVTITEQGEVPQQQLASEFAMSEETLSRRLSSARRHGLIQRRPIGHGEHIDSITEAVWERYRVCWGSGVAPNTDCRWHWARTSER
jgi:DNA-binding transcriptional regulator LsrR (DeoR family)